ncbi:MAG: hypothetical protein ACRDQZ_18410 [Mycobacteriales bacterium]
MANYDRRGMAAETDRRVCRQGWRRQAGHRQGQRRRKPVTVRAGGSIHALGALMVHDVIGDTAEVPLFIAIYAWERLRIDPSPGPRGISGSRASTLSAESR